MGLMIRDLHAVEILDSRARPTLAVTLTTSDGSAVRSGVPSGASTGSREAVERRDGDPARFRGQGVRGAVEAVNGEIASAVRGRSFPTLEALDQALIELDGTENKARLGANAIVGVSMAAARAVALDSGEPLWRSFAGVVGEPRMPVPHFNVLNGGVHARNALDFQEFMIAPVGAPTIAEAVRAGAEIYGVLRDVLVDRGLSAGLGDEGGFAPELTSPEEVLALLVEAIERAGYVAARDGVALAMDPASSEFYRDDAYHVAGESLSSDEMIERYVEMIDRFPIWLLEDGLAESDWDGWVRLTERIGERVELVGDDIFCTNPEIIREAISKHVGNASLIKVNQIGTVTETLEAMRLCHQAGYAQFVSHRSGETEDAFIADLAVGTGSGHIKTGAPARGERVAKYNRLIEIEDAERLSYGLAWQRAEQAARVGSTIGARDLWPCPARREPKTMVSMTANTIDEARQGYDDGKRWLTEGATEQERSYLAAMFAGGFFQVSLPNTAEFASLTAAIGNRRTPGSSVLDFSSSPWLSGFRLAIIEHCAEPD